MEQVFQKQLQSQMLDSENTLYKMMYEQRVKQEQEFIRGAREYAKVKILDRPQRRMDAMIKLKDELLDLSEELTERIKQILERFAEEMYDEKSDEGLLEVPLEEYRKCYALDIEKVEDHLDSELERLQVELKWAETEAENLVEKMRTFLGKNDSLLKKFLDTSDSRVNALSLAAPQREKHIRKSVAMGKYDKKFGGFLEGQTRIDQFKVLANQQTISVDRSNMSDVGNRDMDGMLSNSLIDTTSIVSPPIQPPKEQEKKQQSFAQSAITGLGSFFR